MKPLIRHLTVFLLTLVCTVAAAWVAGGTVAALAAAVAVLALWLLWSGFYTVRLWWWLNRTDAALPGGSGLWHDIFTLLHRREKSRRKRKRQLAQTLRRFNRIASAAPNGVLIVNPQGRIEWLNRLAALHLGLNIATDRHGLLKNLIRAPEFYDFLHNKSRRQTPTLTLRFREDGRPPRSIAVTQAELGGQSRLLITQDITAAEHADTTRTAFVANVSHELRTPLTVINGFLETLADMPDLPHEQQQHFIALMRQEGARMLDLLADLLTLSRLEDKQAPIEWQRVDLSALAMRIAADGRTLSDGRHTIETDIAPDIVIRGIEKDLYSALSNLVFNAVRYTPEGGRIEVALQPQRGGVCLSVRDNGPGIAPEHLPHLTERFYRADAGRSRQSGGTGLGLAITKHALLKHGTDLAIQSQVGQGSEFSAWFALAGKTLERHEPATDNI